jgi:hypothetical protein
LRVGSKLLVDSGASDSNVLVVTSGNIKADFLYGDGSNLTGILESQWTTVNTNELYYNTGNVGIGNQNPSTTLDVTGTSSFSDDLTVGTDKLFVDVSAGRIGLGTATPGYTLDVAGTSSFSDDLAVGTDKLFVDVSAGRIGLGTVTPGYTLDIVGDVNFTGSLTQNGGVFGPWKIGTGTDIYYDQGNVGVANANPQHTLSVGDNLYVEDAGSNFLVIDGNVSCNQITLGEVVIVPSYGLDDVVNESNTTTNTVHLSNVTTGVITTSNALIGGELTVSGDLQANGLFQGNSSLQFFVLTGTHPDPITNQNVDLPNGLTGSQIVSITGITFNTNGDGIPFERHSDSAAWEVDVYFNSNLDQLQLSSQGTQCPSKAWRIFVVTT